MIEVDSRLPDLFRMLLLLGMLTYVVYHELKSGKVYNHLTVSVAVAGMVLNSVLFGAAIEGGFVYGLIWSGIGLLAGFGIYFIFYVVGLMLNCKFIGGGDVKLMAAIGAVSGLHFTIQVIEYTVLFAALMGVYTLYKNKVLLRGIVRAVRVFFLMPPDREDEKPIVEGGVRYSIAIAAGVVVAILHFQAMSSRIFPL